MSKMLKANLIAVSKTKIVMMRSETHLNRLISKIFAKRTAKGNNTKRRCVGDLGLEINTTITPIVYINNNVIKINRDFDLEIRSLNSAKIAHIDSMANNPSEVNKNKSLNNMKSNPIVCVEKRSHGRVVPKI